MKKIITTIILLAYFGMAHAQDRMFAYTYQSNVLNKGDFDLEFQNELKTGKVGDFSPYVFGQRLNQRLEFEIGLGSNIQTSFYLNSELFNYADTASSGLNQKLKISFSNEWKWKLSDPVANAVGFTIYEELEFGGNNYESETKLIFDKRIANELFALNLVGKYEFEREITRINEVTKATWTYNRPVELYFGYMHFFNPKKGFGIEISNQNDITKEGGWMNSVLFAGPSFFTSVNKFFINISVLPQLANLHKTIYAPGNHDLNDFEAAEIRVLVGYDF